MIVPKMSMTPITAIVALGSAVIILGDDTASPPINTFFALFALWIRYS
jgi:hypothetical protein